MESSSVLNNKELKKNSDHESNNNQKDQNRESLSILKENNNQPKNKKVKKSKDKKNKTNDRYNYSKEIAKLNNQIESLKSRIRQMEEEKNVLSQLNIDLQNKVLNKMDEYGKNKIMITFNTVAPSPTITERKIDTVSSLLKIKYVESLKIKRTPFYQKPQKCSLEFL